MKSVSKSKGEHIHPVLKSYCKHEQTVIRISLSNTYSAARRCLMT
jgi:hypothetical protein